MYLVDTNVISEMRKSVARRCHPNVQRWADSVRREFLYVSTITVLELETGILLMDRRDPFQAGILRQWLHGQILPSFAGHILAVDTEVALRCASLHVPIPGPYGDSLIGATALVHGLTVVTRNEKDFEPMGVKVLNPWGPAGTKDDRT